MTNLTNQYEQAKTSGHYIESEEDGYAWLMPPIGHTYDEEGNERPAYIKCLTCGVIHRYVNSPRFQDWSMEHLPGHPSKGEAERNN